MTSSILLPVARAGQVLLERQRFFARKQATLGATVPTAKAEAAASALRTTDSDRLKTVQRVKNCSADSSVLVTDSAEVWLMVTSLPLPCPQDETEEFYNS